MTLELENQRQTAEWFEALKPSVKDMLCRTYGYIVRHENNPKVMADFTDKGIGWACQSTSITGVSEKFIQRFIDNIDHIKNLWENQPSVDIVYWTEWEEEDGRTGCRFKHFTAFGYDEQKRNEKIEHERNDYYQGRWYSKFKNKKVLSKL